MRFFTIENILLVIYHLKYQNGLQINKDHKYTEFGRSGEHIGYYSYLHFRLFSGYLVG